VPNTTGPMLAGISGSAAMPSRPEPSPAPPRLPGVVGLAQLRRIGLR
jgi:hypothetical protein